MSATYDKSQKISFVYSNLHSLYRKGLEAARASELAPKLAGLTTQHGLVKGRVIKAHEVSVKPVAVTASPAVQSRTLHQRKAIESLQSNLKELNELHSRLRFMLKELETLTKKS
ncbi:MAG: hypothetical protein JNL01_09620 [Bdellovibrionales bacterium]|nr:hypothetical protein [Bdellovibrionales bacterium]